MTTSTIELEVPAATRITVTDNLLTAELVDGRIISVPLVWYPRLVHATEDERNNWELHAGSQHIHWADLDEDISVEGLLAGRRSGESQASLKRWFEARLGGAQHYAPRTPARRLSRTWRESSLDSKESCDSICAFIGPACRSYSVP